MAGFFGLDIGSSSIKLVQLSGKTVVSSGVVVNPIGRVGVDLVPTELSTLIDAVKELISVNKIKTRRCVVSVSESLVYTRVMQFPFMSSAELATAIRFEVEQVVPYPIDKLELSWVVLFKPKNAMSGEKMSVLMVAVPTKISNAYVGFMDTLGLEVLRVENEIISISRSLVMARKLPGVSLVVDLGYSNCKFVVADGSQIYVTYLSSLGGMSFTRFIADAFGLPINQAEEYKRVYGLDKQQFEGKLYTAVGPILSGLVADMKKVITGYMGGYPNRKIDRIVLTGGGSFLKGLLAVIAAETGIETVIGNPFDGLKVPETMLSAGPLFSTATGLAIEE